MKSLFTALALLLATWTFGQFSLDQNGLVLLEDTFHIDRVIIANSETLVFKTIGGETITIEKETPFLIKAMKQVRIENPHERKVVQLPLIPGTSGMIYVAKGIAPLHKAIWPLVPGKKAGEGLVWADGATGKYYIQQHSGVAYENCDGICIQMTEWEAIQKGYDQAR